MHNGILRYGGLSAYFFGLITVIGVFLIFMMFIFGGPFGFLNDVSAIISFIPYPVIILSLHKLSPSSTKKISSISGSIGIIGVLGVILLQVLLVTNILSFEQQLPLMLIAGAALGIWLIFSNRLAIEKLGSRVTKIGSTGGVLSVSGGLLFWTGYFIEGTSLNFVNPTTSVGNILMLLGYLSVLGAYPILPIWAILLGRKLLSIEEQ